MISWEFFNGPEVIESIFAAAIISAYVIFGGSELRKRLGVECRYFEYAGDIVERRTFHFQGFIYIFEEESQNMYMS